MREREATPPPSPPPPEDVFTIIRNASSILQEDVIVITVDWARGASATHTYMQTVRNSQVVGRQIALILHSLVKKSDGFLIPKKTHWIGHGLGAQMTIFFWEFYRVLSGNLVIGKITGSQIPNIYARGRPLPEGPRSRHFWSPQTGGFRRERYQQTLIASSAGSCQSFL